MSGKTGEFERFSQNITNFSKGSAEINISGGIYLI
jgi:hypothetical protein